MVLDGPPVPAPHRTYTSFLHPSPPHPSAPAHRRPTPPKCRAPRPPPSKAVASVGRIHRAIAAGGDTGRAKTAFPEVCAQFSTFHGFASSPSEAAQPRGSVLWTDPHATAKPKRVRPASASASLRLGRTRIAEQQSEEVFEGPYAADPRPPRPTSAGTQRGSGGTHRILTVRGGGGSADGRSREDDASEIQKLRGQVADLLNPEH